MELLKQKFQSHVKLKGIQWHVFFRKQILVSEIPKEWSLLLKKVDKSWPTVKTSIVGGGKRGRKCIIVIFFLFNWGKMASCGQAICQKLCKLWPQSRPNKSICNIFSFCHLV